MKILTQEEIKEIKLEYPEIPEEYFSWMSQYGWGELECGFMLYSGPVSLTDIFGVDDSPKFEGLALVGDDMAGYLIGFQKQPDSWQFVGIDSCDMEIVKINESFDEYLMSDN